MPIMDIEHCPACDTPRMVDPDGTVEACPKCGAPAYKIERGGKMQIENDPRTDEQRELDEWQDEAQNVGFGPNGQPM